MEESSPVSFVGTSCSEQRQNWGDFKSARVLGRGTNTIRAAQNNVPLRVEEPIDTHAWQEGKEAGSSILGWLMV